MGLNGHGSFLMFIFQATIHVWSLVRDLHSHKIASGKQEALMDFPQQHDVIACGLVDAGAQDLLHKYVGCLPQIKDINCVV